MTLREKYHRTSKWQDKVVVMELHHLRMKAQALKYKMTQTAEYFGVSIGLVSENLKLAALAHTDPEVLNCANRQEALKYIAGRTVGDNQTALQRDMPEVQGPQHPKQSS